MPIPFHVHPGEDRPIYRQIADCVQQAIAVGRTSPGERLPSHRQLATELVVAPLTVKKAYDELELLGVVETRRGQGTFLTGNARPTHPDSRLRALVDRLVDEARIAGCGDDELLARVADALAPGAALLFLETPSNPTLEIIDLQAVADIAHEAGARLVVDNVFATPVLQRPFEFGADITVYSATKHIDGQGRCLGGIVLADEEFIAEHLGNFLRQTGPALSPFNAWVMLKSLETLDLRVSAHAANGEAVARFLDAHPKVQKTLYPTLDSHPQAALARRQMAAGGNIVALEVKDGKEAAFRLANALQIILISNNLGDAKSLITHPATTTHQRLSEEARAELGISAGLLRLSVGLEDSQDLIEDLDRALAAV